MPELHTKDTLWGLAAQPLSMRALLNFESGTGSRSSWQSLPPQARRSTCTGCTRTVTDCQRAVCSWRKQMPGCLSQAVRKHSSMESAWLHSSMGRSTFRKPRLRASAPGSLRSDALLRWSSKSSKGTLLTLARGVPLVLATSEQVLQLPPIYKEIRLKYIGGKEHLIKKAASI